ncbi:MAG: type II toxin-antitoxin system prevent-host-death family antitoxin [Thermoanaerobaculia bacterium]
MTVLKVDMTDATESLATYVRKADAGPVVITAEGRPVAALVVLENTDLETVALSTDPDFLELIERSRAHHDRDGGLSSAEMRERLERDSSD